MPADKALEVWTAQTICNVGILLSILSFLLHIGRPYFERILGRMTLRVAADLWWLVYVVLRDGSLLFAVLFGFLNLNLDLMADIKIGLPFVPLGTVALSVALVFKVSRNTEDVNVSFRFSAYWVSVGAALNSIGYVLVMEAPGDEYEVARTAFWQVLKSWRSNANPELATITFVVTIVLLASVGVYATIRSLRLFGRMIEGAGKDVPT